MVSKVWKGVFGTEVRWSGRVDAVNGLPKGGGYYLVVDMGGGKKATFSVKDKAAARLKKGDKVTFVGSIDLVSDTGNVSLHPCRLSATDK
jgi:hypothetical protein